ncbi:hypothetical protein [Streptosporangium sp. CA-115845]|uniref:hypothetical protein n=1 Tax=Streptosporangium sp. CA-115845 TaxID=3240071 RepID=UPI003D8BBAB6
MRTDRLYDTLYEVLSPRQQVILEMLDLLVSTELLGKAETAAGKERARQHPTLAKHSATLAAAVEMLLEVTEYGEELRLDQVWEAIDAIVPRRALREAVAAVTEMVPPPDADADGDSRSRPAGSPKPTKTGLARSRRS